MTKNDIMKLDNTIVTLDQMEEIEENESVVLVENNGLSGNKFYGSTWYSVKFDDESEIQVYIK